MVSVPREEDGVLVRLMGMVREGVLAVWLRVGVVTLDETERSDVGVSNDGVEVRVLGD